MSEQILNKEIKSDSSSSLAKLVGAGYVIIAGAGPGDPELITLKLQRRIAEADVIITDRLVNPSIIEDHARKDAEIILVGKQGYNDASVSQEEINELIVAYAKKGKTVLRLKGGDVAFFSNVLDELQSLAANKIEFEIIPGITAASGASAYAGIPLTARGYSQAVQFLTFNPNSYYSPDTWKKIATTNETLVFYMAAKNITFLAELILRFSRKPSTPLAIVEQATTLHQQVHTTTLKDCANDFAEKNFSSPSLVIIGEVVKLYQHFKWKQPAEIGSVFQELEK